jgi:hypothetical protein
MKIFNQARKFGSRLLLSAGVLGLGLVSSAQAAVPAGLSVGTLEADATSILDSVIPVVVSVFTIMVLIRIFKRAGNKI